MDIKALIETDVYDKHFDVIEPEAHAIISFNYAIKVLEDVILASHTPSDVFIHLQIKMNELKQLIA